MVAYSGWENPGFATTLPAGGSDRWARLVGVSFGVACRPKTPRPHNDHTGRHRSDYWNEVAVGTTAAFIAAEAVRRI